MSAEDTIRELQYLIRKYFKQSGLVPDDSPIDIFYKEQGKTEAPSLEDGPEVSTNTFKALVHIPAFDLPQKVDNLRINQVSCSSEQSEKGNFARNAIDPDLKTRWSAKGDEWIELDIGVPQEIHRLDIGFYDGSNRKYQYEIFALAPDNKSLIRLGGGQSSGTLKEGTLEAINFGNPVLTKAIRYLGHGNNLNTWNSILYMSLEGRLVNQPPEDDKTTVEKSKKTKG